MCVQVQKIVVLLFYSCWSYYFYVYHIDLLSFITNVLVKRVILLLYHCELSWGKGMVAYTKPQQRKKEESERLRGERDQIKFIDLGFERWQVVRFRKARGRQLLSSL